VNQHPRRGPDLGHLAYGWLVQVLGRLGLRFRLHPDDELISATVPGLSIGGATHEAPVVNGRLGGNV
jgi:hypothetical protein